MAINVWEAEKYMLSKITIPFLDARMPVKDACNGELGYTAARDGIYIAEKHKVFEMLSDDEKRFFRKGVFAHELLHQIFTDFNFHKCMMDKLPFGEQKIFALFANVLEDPAIEYWAKTKFGGSLLRSLKFSIAHIYEQSPDISVSETPFGQLINALINFGDVGPIKGSFTFPEAKDTFIKIAPMFVQGVQEPCGRKRLIIAKNMMDIARPLWEEEIKEAEAFSKLLSRLMEDSGKSPMSGVGSGEAGDEESLTKETDEKESKRCETLEKMKKEPSEKKSTSDSKDGSEDELKGKSSSKGDSTDTEGVDEVEKKDAKTSSSSPSKAAETPKSSKDADDVNHDDSSMSKDAEMTDKEKEDLNKELEKAEKEMEEEQKSECRDTSEIENTSVKCGKLTFPPSKILNKRADSSEDDAQNYCQIVSQMTVGIANTSMQLKKMLTISQEERESSTRGKINIKRLNSGKNTARVFDKKKTPNNIADLAIGIAVDLSGSMRYQHRIQAARECCIALAEVCHKIDVPVYIMGYTGDCNGYKIVHNHYVMWNNFKKDRESLAGITDECENYDGASFRYFTGIIRKRQAKHKLMVIISDGVPWGSGSGYCGAEANKDTAMAIRDARRCCDVLGVAIGNDDTKTLQSFYGGDFIHVATPNDLFSQLSNKLKKYVHKWAEEE